MHQNSSLFSATGSVVDVGQLLAQLSRSEKSRADSERRLTDTTKKLNEIKDASEKLAVGKEKLQVRSKISITKTLDIDPQNLFDVSRQSFVTSRDV